MTPKQQKRNPQPSPSQTLHLLPSLRLLPRLQLLLRPRVMHLRQKKVEPPAGLVLRDACSIIVGVPVSRARTVAMRWIL